MRFGDACIQYRHRVTAAVVACIVGVGGADDDATAGKVWFGEGVFFDVHNLRQCRERIQRICVHFERDIGNKLVAGFVFEITPRQLALHELLHGGDTLALPIARLCRQMTFGREVGVELDDDAHGVVGLRFGSEGGETGVGDGELGIGNWRLEIGGWSLEMVGWRLGVGIFGKRVGQRRGGQR